MNIEEAKKELLDTFRYNLTCTRHTDKVTPMLWGPAGVGKSTIVYDVAKELGYEVVELRLATINPVDARGFPVEDKATGKGAFLLPYYFPVGDDNRKIIIFLDEINTALPMNQVTGYEMCQDYSVGGKKLPMEVLVVAAGNREEDGGATFEMPLPLANRLQHIEVLPSVKAWIGYAMRTKVREEVVGYLNFKQQNLYDPTPTEKAFPSPRSWDKLSKRVGQSEFTERVVSSIVGSAVAADFMSFIRVRSKLPDLDKALDEGIPFQNTDRSIMYSFVTGLAYRLSNAPTINRVVNFARLMKTLPPELATVGYHLTITSMTQFVIENYDECQEYHDGAESLSVG